MKALLTILTLINCFRFGLESIVGPAIIKAPQDESHDRITNIIIFLGH